MEPKNVSKRLLLRLPVYLNYLKSLPEHTTDISATRIAGALGLGDVMVRKDLAKVSNGGRRKVGHDREMLIQDIEDFLDINSIIGTVLVGTGKLGQALLDYDGFEASGMSILAGFDINPEKKRTNGKKRIFHVSRLKMFCASNDVRIGIIAVPAHQAQGVCDELVACGVRGIWNFAPVHLNVPGNVTVQNENLAVSLASLRVQLKETVKH